MPRRVVIEELRSLPVTLERYTAAEDIFSTSSEDYPNAASSETMASTSPFDESVFLERFPMVLTALL